MFFFFLSVSWKGSKPFKKTSFAFFWGSGSVFHWNLWYNNEQPKVQYRSCRSNVSLCKCVDLLILKSWCLIQSKVLFLCLHRYAFVGSLLHGALQKCPYKKVPPSHVSTNKERKWKVHEVNYKQNPMIVRKAQNKTKSPVCSFPILSQMIQGTLHLCPLETRALSSH